MVMVKSENLIQKCPPRCAHLTRQTKLSRITPSMASAIKPLLINKNVSTAFLLDNACENTNLTVSAQFAVRILEMAINKINSIFMSKRNPSTKIFPTFYLFQHSNPANLSMTFALSSPLPPLHWSRQADLVLNLSNTHSPTLTSLSILRASISDLRARWTLARFILSVRTSFSPRLPPSESQTVWPSRTTLCIVGERCGGVVWWDVSWCKLEMFGCSMRVTDTWKS